MFASPYVQELLYVACEEHRELEATKFPKTLSQNIQSNTVFNVATRFLQLSLVPVEANV